MGLSGSLGSDSEAKFLDEIYGAWSYVVPPFLDTCVRENGALIGKCTAKFLENEITIHPSKKLQKRNAVELAISKCTVVPVLIICENREDAKDLVTDIVSRMIDKAKVSNFSSSYGVTKQNASTFVQRFSEFDDENQEMDWGAIVSAGINRTCCTLMESLSILT